MVSDWVVKYLLFRWAAIKRTFVCVIISDFKENQKDKGQKKQKEIICILPGIFIEEFWIFEWFYLYETIVCSYVQKESLWEQGKRVTDVRCNLN